MSIKDRAYQSSNQFFSVNKKDLKAGSFLFTIYPRGRILYQSIPLSVRETNVKYFM